MQAVEKLMNDADDYRRWAAEDDGKSSELWLGEAEACELRVLDPLQRDRESLELRKQQLRDWWNDREVWVRTSGGGPLEAYHVGPACGHVSGRGRRPGLFDRLFEGEARARGLRPCPVGACYAELRSASSATFGS